jgi:hypothetical protein
MSPSGRKNLYLILEPGHLRAVNTQQLPVRVRVQKSDRYVRPRTTAPDKGLSQNYPQDKPAVY